MRNGLSQVPDAPGTEPDERRSVALAPTDLQPFLGDGEPNCDPARRQQIIGIARACVSELFSPSVEVKTPLGSSRDRVFGGSHLGSRPASYGRAIFLYIKSISRGRLGRYWPGINYRPCGFVANLGFAL